MSNSVDNMDRVFFDCLREIERNYLHLSKQLRIRVEKWVEKLVSTGNNEVWRKHRNAYAKLLLNMVIGKNLSDPFHTLPLDGPLPTYPFHLKSFTNKNLLGAHESIFWHELYNRFQNKDLNDHLIENAHNTWEGAQSTSHESSKTLTTLPQSREISNLNLLIKEQAKRIQLLEQQLHDERMQHELQIQRLHYSHRIDVGALKSELSKSIDTATGFRQSQSNDPAVGNLSSASPVRLTASMPTFSAGVNLFSYDAPMANQQSRHPSTNSRQSRAFDDELSSSRQLSAPEDGDYGPLMQRSAVLDITPSPDKKYSYIPAALSTNAVFPREVTTGYAADPFFAHIDQFQSEIQKINSALHNAMTLPDAAAGVHMQSMGKLHRSEFSD